MVKGLEEDELVTTNSISSANGSEIVDLVEGSDLDEMDHVKARLTRGA